MTEKLLQFIWQHQYFNRSCLQTTNAESLEILFQGQHNCQQGPDFLQARVRVGAALLAGSVELHLKTSFWEKHRHEDDPHYRNVVLHVVYEHDKEVNDLPVLELAPRVSRLLLEYYSRLMQSDAFIPCSTRLQQVPALTWAVWKERLLAERLQRKAAHLVCPLAAQELHWEEGLWRLLARSFGARTNADAFEAIARSLPIKILARHRHNLLQLEALLLGQARLLNHQFSDDYALMLQREYKFLQQKLGLVPINLPVYFLRMRPQNFPTIRLAQLAALLQKSSHLFSRLLEADTLTAMETLLDATANDYWHYHFRFDEASAYQPKKLGKEMMQHLLVNVVAPVLYAYGSYHGNPVYIEKAMDLLRRIPAESNAVIRGFQKLGIRVEHASDAQALLELRNAYCNEKRCLECTAGNTLLKRSLFETT